MKKIFNLFIVVMILILTICITGCNKMVDNNDEITITLVKDNDIKLSSSNYSNNQLVINASIEPINAVNKKLDWEFNFKKNEYPDEVVFEHINVEVSKDTLTCYITYVKSFDWPIVLTVRSITNPNVSAWCQIECASRTYEIYNVDVDYDSDVTSTSNSIVSLFSNNGIIDFSNVSLDEMLSNKDLISFSGIEFNKKGTVNTASNVEIFIQWSSSIHDTCIDLYYSENLFVDGEIELADGSFTFKKFIKDNTLYEAAPEDVIDVLSNCSYWFDLIVYIQDIYDGKVINTYSQIFKLTGFDSSVVQIDTIILDQTNPVI